MSDDEIFVVAQACAYNKYRGQAREGKQLYYEIDKARDKIEGASETV